MKKDIIINVVLILLFLILSFLAGYSYSENEFNKYRISKQQEIYKYKQELRDREIKHKEYEDEILSKYKQEKEEYEKSITNITNEYNSRLLEQDNRASYYKRQYEDSNCNNPELVNRTIQFDKAIAEGISLVKELRELVILKERTINSLIMVIENDRDTVNGK